MSWSISAATALAEMEPLGWNLIPKSICLVRHLEKPEVRDDGVDEPGGEEWDPVDLPDALRELCDARPEALLDAQREDVGVGELRLPGQDLVAEDEGEDLVDLVVQLGKAGQPGAGRRHRVGREAVGLTVRCPGLPAREKR